VPLSDFLIPFGVLLKRELKRSFLEPTKFEVIKWDR
jgi:hypothetical protein